MVVLKIIGIIIVAIIALIVAYFLYLMRDIGPFLMASFFNESDRSIGYSRMIIYNEWLDKFYSFKKSVNEVIETHDKKDPAVGLLESELSLFETNINVLYGFFIISDTKKKLVKLAKLLNNGIKRIDKLVIRITGDSIVAPAQKKILLISDGKK